MCSRTGEVSRGEEEGDNPELFPIDLFFLFALSCAFGKISPDCPICHQDMSVESCFMIGRRGGKRGKLGKIVEPRFAETRLNVRGSEGKSARLVFEDAFQHADGVGD